MKKQLSFGAIIILLTTLIACSAKEENKEPANSSVSSSSRSSRTSTSRAPVKSITNLSISLDENDEDEKVYITVKGTQKNYTSDDFSWAWGLMDRETSEFADGQAKPAASDFSKAEFDANNEFVIKYCLTDIKTIKAGRTYRVYGGTPETYADIQFANELYGASDATRKYYLRQDLEYSLTFDDIQPVAYSEAAIVKIAQSDLPDGVTNPGAYLKFGGQNTKNLTIDTINAWNEAGNIAGDFQCCIPTYKTHTHTNDERFWAIEDDYIYFYLYCGFIEAKEGWMVHFDLVSGNPGAHLYVSTTYNGESFNIDGTTYKLYSNQSGDEEHYWGAVGVYREA